jgi:hypothetical protein
LHARRGDLGVVLGYHGTSEERVEKILSDGFEHSRNPYDWLGTGTYFFADAPSHALAHATKYRRGESPCVIVAQIDLDGCLDFFDLPAMEQFAQEYERYEKTVGTAAIADLQQNELLHEVDRAVFNYMYANLDQRGGHVKVVRCPFAAGGPAWRVDVPGRRVRQSAVSAYGHVQILVRDHSAIIGQPERFDVGPDDY